MNNYQQKGEVLQLTAPYTVASGGGMLVGAAFGVAKQAAASGVSVPCQILGVASLVKNSGEAWTQGMTVYWDNTNKRCTSVSSANTKIGFAIQAQLSADVTAPVCLNGTV